MKELMTETMVLPSAAVKLYGPNFDGVLNLRAMTTKEERIRLSGQFFYEVMSNIVNECIVDNKNPDGSYKIDSKMFTEFDFFAVLVKLRIMSYGPLYKTVATCHECGSQFITTVDLADLECKLVPEGFVEPYTIGPLPYSKDVLGCRFLRVMDRIEIEKKKQIILAKEPNYIGDPTYQLEMHRRIMEVNGEPIDIIAVEDYVDGMIAMDSQMYHDEVEKNFGIIRLGLTDCKNPKGCDGHPWWVLQPDREFFRSVVPMGSEETQETV